MSNNSGVNKVFLLGHIKSAPRRHKSVSHADTICFTLVTKETLRKSDKLEEHEEYHNLIVYEGNPDIRSLELKSGSQVYVTGKIQTKGWVDENNIRRYKTEIVVLQLQLMGTPDLYSDKPQLISASV